MNRIYKLITFLLLLIFNLFFGINYTLADFNFSTNTNTLIPDGELVVNVNLSVQGQANKIYYLEGAFKKEGSSNYFGLTWNDTNWVAYSASNFTNLKKITTDQSGSWSGIVKAKLDPNSSLFTGAGNYIFTVKRFTEAGSSNWSDDTLTLSVNIASPAPSPSSSPTNFPTPPSSPSPAGSTSSFVISSLPTSINSSDTLTVLVQINNLEPHTQYFLKGAFVKSGSTNYFGKTLYSGNWVKNSQSATTQFSITTDEVGNWQGNLTVALDTDDSGYSGSGDYIFKVARYSSSGIGPTWSNQATINIKDNQPAHPDTSSTPNSDKISSSNFTSSSASPQAPHKAFSAGGFPSPLSVSSSLSKLPTLASVAGVATQSSQSAAIPTKGLSQINLAFLAGGTISILVGLGALVYIFKKR